MPQVDVLDDTFVRAPVDAVCAASAACWEGWLPALRLETVQDRGPKGVRWAASTVGRGGPGGRLDLVGTAEVWLEPVPGGTVVHLYVRLDPAAAGAPPVRLPRNVRVLPDRLRRTWKRGLHRCKDDLEGART